MLLRPKDIEAAASVAKLWKHGWSRDPMANYEAVMARLGQLGFRLVRKYRLEPGSSWATTLAPFRQIRIPFDWHTKTLRTRAAIAAHELVHAEQGVSVVRYAAARYRWRVEVPAWRESLRIWHAHDPLLDIEKAIDGILEKFGDLYLIDDPRAHSEARRIWMQDWG